MVSGSEYPPPPNKVLLAKIVSYIQWGIMIVMLAGDWIFPKLGIVPPPIYYRMKEKQFIVIMACMFLGGQISNGLTSTGAFEVFVDNKLVFSKLQMDRMPSPGEIERFLN